MNQILCNKNLKLSSKTNNMSNNKILSNKVMDMSNNKNTLNEIKDINNTENFYNKIKSPQLNYLTQNVKHIKWYKIVFFISLFLLIFFVFLLFTRLYKNKQNEKISKKLTSSYSISTMYSVTNTTDYNTPIVNNTPFVIRNN